MTGRAIVTVQGPVVLSDITQPQPDLTLVVHRGDWYASAHPRPPAILLAIEVADSSLVYDRGIKAPLYARRGVPELWIVAVAAHRLEVHRQPGEEGYEPVTVLGPDDAATVEALPDLRLPVADLLS